MTNEEPKAIAWIGEETILNDSISIGLIDCLQTLEIECGLGRWTI